MTSNLAKSQVDTCIAKFSEQQLHTNKYKKFPIDHIVGYKEIKRFNVKSIPNAVILENGYAEFKIKNNAAWKPNYNKIEVTEVEIIFTKYPIRPENWFTNYNKLLRERLAELFRLDPKLNCNHISFKIILQTDCSNDSMAKAFFHGIVIKYKPVNRRIIKRPIQNKDSVEKIPYHKQVEEFIKSQGGLNDSTAYKIFDRHPEWKKSLVVMDWTSSMYPYGASVVLWHSLHYNKSGIKFYTFFNDGDNKPEYAKTLGNAGGIYHAKADNLDEVIKLFKYVMSKGTGGDISENDMEALLKAMREYPDFNEIILIADNNACIRDFVLSDSINVPVKIILCGTQNGINPAYLNLAAKTKGSLHTIEEDIYSMQENGIGQEQIKIGGIDFSKNVDGLYIRTDGKKEDECMKYYVKAPDPKPKPKPDPKPAEPTKVSSWKKLMQKLGLSQ
ncbi:MAG: hypothetical protein HYZ42_06410 [Bacteroidetes bacterium]|nr:hypothetical protein [Bacteroidota bacterium]